MPASNKHKRRAFIVVIDALGIGALPDHADYNDPPECNTLGNVAEACGGLHLPNLGRLGLGNIIPVKGVPAVESPLASIGRMMEVSQGKDTTTGHWEIAGLVLDKPFKVYPDGFPPDVMQQFVKETGCGGFLGNIPASGTAIIEQHNEEHVRTGHPIVYTSADSVFQIAVNTDVVSLDKLYSWCESARSILTDEYNVSRVIARPYFQSDGDLQRNSAGRRDLAVSPTKPTVLNQIADAGGQVFGIGKIVDIFVGSGITHSVHTGGNLEGLKLTCDTIEHKLDMSQYREAGTSTDDADYELVFVNLVDTDALYGHRNDPVGYGKALEEIDTFIPRMLDGLNEQDMLIFTGDHGCDPTMPGTDHSREYVPLLVVQPGSPVVDLGTCSSFAWIADKVSEWLGVAAS